MRHSRFVIFVLCVAVAACASVQTRNGPGGYTYRLKRDKTIKVELPAPETWTAEFVSQPTSSFMVRSPDSRVLVMITLAPMETDMSRLLQEAKKHFEQAAQAHTLTFHDIEGTVSGRRARGLELDGEKAKVTLLAVDHDRGIYVVLLVIAKDADQNERDAGAFIFEQIRIIEDQ